MNDDDYVRIELFVEGMRDIKECLEAMNGALIELYKKVERLERQNRDDFK